VSPRRRRTPRPAARPVATPARSPGREARTAPGTGSPQVRARPGTTTIRRRCAAPGRRAAHRRARIGCAHTQSVRADPPRVHHARIEREQHQDHDQHKKDERRQQPSHQPGSAMAITDLHNPILALRRERSRGASSNGYGGLIWPKDVGLSWLHLGNHVTVRSGQLQESASRKATPRRPSVSISSRPGRCPVWVGATSGPRGAVTTIPIPWHFRPSMVAANERRGSGPAPCRAENVHSLPRFRATTLRGPGRDLGGDGTADLRQVAARPGRRRGDLAAGPDLARLAQAPGCNSRVTRMMDT